MTIKILFFGDTVSSPGRDAIKKELPNLKKKFKPDLVIANAENLAHIHGVTINTIKEMQEAGINFFTSGNDVFKKYQKFIEIIEDKSINIIRPANYPKETPGVGEMLIKIKNNNILLINLLGRVFMKEDVDCPFRKLDEILKKYSKKKISNIIVDFHAETTSENMALGFYADGRVAALLGTHTHIPTADERILPNGTGYITDIGMTGSLNSILGAKKENIIQRYLTQIQILPIEPEKEGPAVLNAIYLEINNNKTVKIKRIQKIIK